MKTLKPVFIILFSLSVSLGAQEKSGPRIQVALLLDTSSSMDGLIDQARSRLWKVVNELAFAEKGSQTPVLEVSLFEYGKSTISREEGYMRMVTPFTGDLDRISSDLFSLKTCGGDEYCGLVIKRAVQNLNWDRNDGNIKIIFIAGNESFTQGDNDYRESIRFAREKGITVNTIFCGDYGTGINIKWKEGADLGGGTYMNIDHNNAPQIVSTPQDGEINRLGLELNSTYIPFGAAGEKRKAVQSEEDNKAMDKSGSVAAERSISKASKYYVNTNWDLVDAVKNGKADLNSIRKEDLPANMRNMTQGERKRYVEAMYRKRLEIQKRIGELNEKRNRYITDQKKNAGEKESLDSAMIKSIRKEAEKKNFRFK